MTKEINQKFNWQSEAKDYIRETFENIGTGYAYYGRIIIKSTQFGFDKNNNLVWQFTNKFGTLYMTCTSYAAIVTNNQPEMKVIF